MPKPKKKAPSKNPIREVLEKARALDRRRQAQIENQKQAITRLLEALNGHQPVKDVLVSENQLLIEAVSDAQARIEELEQALSDAQTPAEALAG